MNLLHALDETIHPKFRISPSNNLLTIQERQNDGTVKDNLTREVKFKTTGPTFAFTLDGPGEPFPYFQENQYGLKKKNDCIIVSLNGHTPYILVVELKSSKITNKAWMQLILGGVFMKFVVECVQAIFPGAITSIPEYRYVLCSTRRTARKTPTRRISIVYQIRDGKKFTEVYGNRSYELIDFMH